jgi:hypothetical protein
MYHALGIDPATALMNPLNRPQLLMEHPEKIEGLV